MARRAVKKKKKAPCNLGEIKTEEKTSADKVKRKRPKRRRSARLTFLALFRFNDKDPWREVQLAAEPFCHPQRLHGELVGSVIWRMKDVLQEDESIEDRLLRIDAVHICADKKVYQAQIQTAGQWLTTEVVSVADVWHFRDQDQKDICQLKGDLWPLAVHIDLPREVLDQWADRAAGLEDSDWPANIIRDLSETQVSGEARVFFCTRAFLEHTLLSAFPEACLLTFGAWKLGLSEGVRAAADALPAKAVDLLAQHDAEGKSMHGNVYAKKSKTEVPMWCGGFTELRRHLQEAGLTEAPCYLHEFSASALLNMPDSQLNIIMRCLNYCNCISPHFEHITKGFFADAGVSFPGHYDVVSWNQSIVQVLGSKVLLSDVRWEQTESMSTRFGDKGYKDGTSIPLHSLSSEEADMLDEFRSRVLVLPGDVAVFCTSQFHASVNPSRGLALFAGFVSWSGLRRFVRDPRSLWACGDNPSTGEAITAGEMHRKLEIGRKFFKGSENSLQHCQLLRSPADHLHWAQICDQAEEELKAGEKRLFHTSEKAKILPLELGEFGRGIVRNPPVLKASLKPASFDEEELKDALRRYKLRLDADSICELLQLADDKLHSRCLFDHAYAQLELAERLHRQLFGKQCGPALWNQACCLSEAVSMELARARSTCIASLHGSNASWPNLPPFVKDGQACAVARLDAAVALVKKALRAPSTLGDWPPPAEQLLEADNLDALRKFRSLDTLLHAHGGAGGNRKKRTRR